MKVASKIEVAPYVNPDPLTICLDIWVRWHHRSDSGIGNGWKGKAAMLESEASADSEQLYDRMDTVAAEAVEASIDSLSKQHAWAIRKRCGIMTVWRFPNADYADVLAKAEESLINLLKRNTATRAYF